MLQDVGLFDEEFIGYCEDVDLSFRAQLAGYGCVYAPAARVYHKISATGGGPRASFLCGRNFLNVVVKNWPAELLRRHWRRILKAQLGISFRSLRHFRDKATRAWLLGQIDALSQLPAMLSKRRAIQARRRISASALEAMMDT
jgi:GT2 family glycosyltransferase